MTSFTDLRLAEPILKALAEEGYATPTPIQAKAITPVMEGHDLLGIAQTGTGKTAAFALPILHRLAANRRPAPRKGCRALILSPTRELASQIADSFRAYGRHLGMTVAVVFGGVGHRPQIQALSRGVDILVATPGRLIDHMESRHADISGTEIFVLDEADQMLDLGFVKPIRRIVSHLAQRRQNLFFSATMPGEIAGLASEMLKDPVKVAVAPVATTAERVRQRVILIEAAKKRTLLAELLADPEMTRTLVFTRTKRGADRVAHHLEGAGMKAAAIHGNKSQRQREIALEDFKQSRITVLVATDIAARGIDIDLVTHVVNYELPEVPEAYVHRIGRTARAGASGIAISLCDVEERDQLRAIEKLTRQQIPHEDRRNDTSLVAPPRQSGGGGREAAGDHAQRRGGSHGKGRPAGERGRGEHRHGDRPHGRPGERGHDGHGNGHAHGRASEQRRRGGDGSHRGHREDGHLARSAEAGHGNGGGHRHERRRDDAGGRQTDPTSLKGVSFMARPAHREHANGGHERLRANRGEGRQAIHGRPRSRDMG